MNTRKITGTIVLVVGIVVLILFATADLTGIAQNPKFFGPVQIAGVIVGVVVAIVGLVILLKKQKPVANA
jgi:uncharacterized membrane protein